MRLSSGRAWATSVTCDHPGYPSVSHWAHRPGLPATLPVPRQLTPAAQPATAGGGPRGLPCGLSDSGHHRCGAGLQTWHILGLAAEGTANRKDLLMRFLYSRSNARPLSGVGDVHTEVPRAFPF